MSGPTGVRGPQGPRGQIGVVGPTGIQGMFGPQGVQGPLGFTGRGGIGGSTGIQLYGNGSLVQCAARTGTPALSTNGNYQTIGLNAVNPALSGSNSVSISGQYDASGLNYYGNPLVMSQPLITIPNGKYFISATLSTKDISGTNITSLDLASYNGVSYTTIVTGIAARPGSDCHLQHYYTPSTDTTVSLRARTSTSGQVFTEVIGNVPYATLSIVKIW